MFQGNIAEKIKVRYEREVKPRIASEQFGAAEMEVANLLFMLEQYSPEMGLCESECKILRLGLVVLKSRLINRGSENKELKGAMQRLESKLVSFTTYEIERTTGSASCPGGPQDWYSHGGPRDQNRHLRTQWRDSRDWYGPGGCREQPRH